MKTRIVPMVLACDYCGSFAHPVVRWDVDEEPYVTNLPERCVVCRHPLGTPDVTREVIATARNLVETAHIIRGDS